MWPNLAYFDGSKMFPVHLVGKRQMEHKYLSLFREFELWTKPFHVP